MDTLHQLIYTSVLAADVNPTCVSQILRTARSNNPRFAVTGLLIFDGLRVCQYLEGPSASVCGLAQRISVDARHVQFDVKEHGELTGRRRFPDWPMGYALASHGDELNGFENLAGRSAIAALDELLPSLELEPPTIAKEGL